MLFRDKDGELFELMRDSFVSDKEYYKILMSRKGYNDFAKDKSSKDIVIDIIRKGRSKRHR
jgi:hypothetical protein